MKPSRHIIASLTLGAVLWLFTKSVYAGLLCFASGVLVDVDHIVDYIIQHGWRSLTFRNMYEACEQTGRQEGDLKFKKLYIILHSAEIVLLFWAIVIYTKNIYFLAVTLGYSLHLILDRIANPVYSGTYFRVWRAINRFDSSKFFKSTKCEK